VLLVSNFCKLYGVDSLVIPLISLVDELQTIHKVYEANGHVRFKKALVIPEIASKSDFIFNRCEFITRFG
jgi:hypothetical protein